MPPSSAPAPQYRADAMPSALDVLKIAGLAPQNQNWPDGADARFCELTDAANQALGCFDDEVAFRLYVQALAEAERLFDAAQVGGSPLIAPMAYTIACHNVAEARKRSGDRVLAHELKRRAVEKLVVTAESPLDALALRVNCVRHLRHALAFLAKDLADADAKNRADAESLFDRCQTVGENLTRLAKHVMSERTDVEVGDSPSPRQGRLN